MAKRETGIELSRNVLLYGERLSDYERQTCLDLQTAISVLRRSGVGDMRIDQLIELGEKKMQSGTFGMFLSNIVLAYSKDGMIDRDYAITEIASEYNAMVNSMATHGAYYSAELAGVRERTFPRAKKAVTIEMVPEHLLRQGYTSPREQLSGFLQSQTGRPSIVPADCRGRR